VYADALSYLPAEHDGIFFLNVAAINAASSELSGTVFEGNDMFEDAVDSSDEIPVDSIAVVGWSEDGNSRVSAIVVVP
jgi:hypothetical protein